MKPYFEHDAVVLGWLFLALGFVFYTSRSENPFWKQFYKYVPSLLLCYFIPALLHSPLNFISAEVSQLDEVASDYMLPACLILFCVSIDLKGIFSLGGKALIMFLAGTFGVILGGPVAVLVVSYFMPSVLEIKTGEPLWSSLAPIAGSWIGGGANQLAMKKVSEVSDQVFSTVVVVDILVANVWMGLLLYGASITKRIDKWLKADTSPIEALKEKVENYRKSITKTATATDTILILSVAFVGTALSHVAADIITPFMKNYAETLDAWSLNTLYSRFFWLVVMATSIGFAFSFTKARQLEGVGASQIGSVLIYFLVATIGMKMDVMQIFANLGLFAIGFVWMSVHVLVLVIVAKITRSPFFFMAVGSQANIGGAASAPIVAAAFSPALAPVGVLLAVLGYALGTYGGLVCAQLMQWVSP